MQNSIRGSSAMTMTSRTLLVGRQLSITVELDVQAAIAQKLLPKTFRLSLSPTVSATITLELNEWDELFREVERADGSAKSAENG